MRLKIKGLPLLVFSVSLPLLVGFISSFFTVSSIPTWYAVLNKPSFSPPNWVFGPVWTTLYFLMGVSFFLVLRKGINQKTKVAIEIFFLQLMLNFLWSLVFFGLHSIVGALVIIILLWILIILTIIKFMKISKVSGQLMFPYLAWVTFATVLNLSLFLLNR